MSYKLTFGLIFCVFLVQVTWSQTIEVSGKVMDTNGKPLIGANVISTGTSNGTIVDFDGNYTITVDAKSQLTFSYLGYTPQVVEVDGRSVIDVTLLEDLKFLSEVIVMGYSKEKKQNVIGAVASVSGDALVRNGVTNISQAIQDRLPGVFTEISSGQPGADDANITIRGVSSFKGDNTPLILIDGVEATGGFSQLNPGEIASINVLKDASSTAVYGVRGADGVILITTRRGRMGSPQITVSSGVTAKTLADIPDQLGSYELLTLGQEAIKNSNNYDGLRPQRYIDTFLDPNRDIYAYPDVDWYDALVRDIGWESNARINVSGGTDFVKYFSAFSVNHIGDVMKTEDFDGYYNPEFSYDKINFRTNLDFNLTKTTALKVDISGRSENRKTPNADVGANQFSNLFKIIDQGSPYVMPLYYPEEFVLTHPDPLAAFPGGIRYASAIAENPFQENGYTSLNFLGMRNFRKDVVDVQIGLSQRLDAIAKGLGVSGRFNYSTAYDYRKVEKWPNKLWLYDAILGEWRQQAGPGYNSSDPEFRSKGGEEFNGSRANIYYEFKIDYERNFNSHNVGFVGSFNRTEKGKGPAVLPEYSEDWVGIASYNFDERYIFKVSAGYNGSEKFAPGKRFGFFPAAAIGWNIAREKILMDNLPWLNDLKVRYSYGKTGTERSAARFLYQGGYDALGLGFAYARFGFPQAPEVARHAEVKIANPNATWETAFKHNLGVDLEVLDRDLFVSVNFYKENREGIFISVPVPTYYHPGFGSTLKDKGGEIGLPEVNQGETKNHGIEFEANYSHLLAGGLKFSLGGNFTLADSRIVYSGDKILTPDYQKNAGKPIGWLSGYQSNGYIKDFEQAINSPDISGGNRPGLYSYADFNGDGKIDVSDNVALGETNQPAVIYAFNGGLSYKGFNFGIRFFGKDGVTYHTNKLFPNFNNTLLEAKTVHLDRWSPENQEAAFPAFGNIGTAQGYKRKSDATARSTAYLKLQNVSLGYTIESKYIERLLKIRSMNLNISGQNLYTWSKLPFGDPEGGNGVAGGYGQYPLVRRFIFDISINF